MKTTVNWGIIGLGNAAKNFANAFNFTKNSKLLAVSSRVQKKIDEFKNSFNLRNEYCFENYNDLLNCTDVDIIYIALPNSFHYEWIIKCINKGKNILVEKPSTINFSQIQKVENLLKDKDIFFSEGLMYRYHPQISKVIELLRNNIIGNLISMESFFGHKIFKNKKIFGIEIGKIKKDNRLYNKELGGGAILDLGSYPVSMGILIASLNSKISVKDTKVCKIKNINSSTEVDIDSFAEINFNNNFKCSVGASFIQDIGKKTKIIGTKGEIILEDSWTPKNFSKIKINGIKNETIKIKCASDIYSDQINSISNSILQNKNKPNFPGMTLTESVENMKILDKWRDGRVV